MKIGIISTVGGDCSWAGSEEAWRIFALEAAKEGHELVVQAGDKIASSQKLDILRDQGVRILPHKDLTSLTRRLTERRWLNRFKIFFACNHDVIFLSMGGIEDCLWIPDLLHSLKCSSVPVVVIVQANAEGMAGSERARRVLKNFYARAAMVIFLSVHNQRLAERQLAWRFPKTCRIMNPLREPVEKPLPWPELPDGSLHFAEVARFEINDKQQDHLLEALSTPEWKDRNWRLTFFGSGKDETHIRLLIDFYDLADKVQIGGFVDDFRDIWKQCHLHILPSRREGMPLSLIESMACGRPALVTRAGGNAELVDEGQNGFISPGMHPEVLRDTLESAWDTREQWKDMGASAHEKVVSLVHDNWGKRILDVVVNSANEGSRR